MRNERFDIAGLYVVTTEHRRFSPAQRFETSHLQVLGKISTLEDIVDTPRIRNLDASTGKHDDQESR